MFCTRISKCARHTHTHTAHTHSNENKTTDRSTNSFSILSLPIMYNRNNYLPNVWCACDIQVFGVCLHTHSQSCQCQTYVYMSVRLNHWSAWAKIETLTQPRFVYTYRCMNKSQARQPQSIFSISFCLRVSAHLCAPCVSVMQYFYKLHSDFAFCFLSPSLFPSLGLLFGSFISVLAFCINFIENLLYEKQIWAGRLLLNFQTDDRHCECVCVCRWDHNIVLAGGRSAHTVWRSRARRSLADRPRCTKWEIIPPWTCTHRIYSHSNVPSNGAEQSKDNKTK